MKIFVSLPITGREDSLQERFESAMDFIKEHYPDAEIEYQSNLKVLSSEQRSCSEEEFPYYMGKDIQSVLECDAILMCEGFQHSIGCLLEYRAAELFKKQIIIEN